MKWISNGDPPLYVWEGDIWYNQKDKLEYLSISLKRKWICHDIKQGWQTKIPDIEFPKKTRVMK
jgi:hypothetical protein